MGSVFSQEEKKEIAPHLGGVDPLSLATVIWDCINEEGMDSREDDEDEGNLGISFDGDGSEEGKNNVVFWDDGETTSLPKNVFLEIMKMSGEQVVKTFEDNYDLERSKELGESVAALKTALQHLEQHLSTIESTISAEEYRKLIDGEIEPEEIDSDDEVPESVATVEIDRVPTPIPIPLPTADEDADDSDSSEEATSPPNNLLQRRRSTKGIEGVMDRLPELWRRFSDEDPETPTSPTSPRAFDKVKKKVKLLSMFHVQRDNNSPEEKENPEFDDKFPKPEENPDDKLPRPATPKVGDDAKKIRSSSVGNFYTHHNPPSHQLSLPGDLSALAALSQVSKLRQASHIKLLSPDATPVPSLPGSIEDVSKSPDHTTTNSPISPRRMFGSLFGSFTINSSTSPGGADNGGLGSPTPPRSPTPPGVTGSSTSNTPTPPCSGASNSTPTPPGGKSKKLPTPPGSFDTDSPTPTPGPEDKYSQLAWANSLDSINSSSTVSMGPQNFPAPEGIGIGTSLLLPGSVDNSSPPP